MKKSDLLVLRYYINSEQAGIKYVCILIVCMIIRTKSDRESMCRTGSENGLYEAVSFKYPQELRNTLLQKCALLPGNSIDIVEHEYQQEYLKTRCYVYIVFEHP